MTVGGWWHWKSHCKYHGNGILLCLCMQRSARRGQASGSRRRPWCWRAATFPPPFCRLPAKGWACWRTQPAPWRSWETRGPSTTASKWSSSWAAAPQSPTAREKGTGGRGWETCMDTVYRNISDIQETHKEKETLQTHNHTVSGVLACSYWTDLLNYTDSYQAVRIFFMDCPSHHPNPTEGGTCRVHTLVAADHYQNIRSILSFLPSWVPFVRCSATAWPQRGAIMVQCEWCVRACVCVCVCEAWQRYSLLHLVSIVPPPIFLYIDAPSTCGSAQWVWVAGCSDWLQSEASLVRGKKTTKLWIGQTAGLLGGKPLHRLFK